MEIFIGFQQNFKGKRKISKWNQHKFSLNETT
jgi:hypothetical protein